MIRELLAIAFATLLLLSIGCSDDPDGLKIGMGKIDVIHQLMERGVTSIKPVARHGRTIITEANLDIIDLLFQGAAIQVGDNSGIRIILAVDVDSSCMVKAISVPAAAAGIVRSGDRLNKSECKNFIARLLRQGQGMSALSFDPDAVSVMLNQSEALIVQQLRPSDFWEYLPKDSVSAVRLTFVGGLLAKIEKNTQWIDRI